MNTRIGSADSVIAKKEKRTTAVLRELKVDRSSCWYVGRYGGVPNYGAESYSPHEP
jgi:hypothetical protein